jgi:hypothetical protein
MRMSRGSGQDILDDPLGEFSRPLVFLQHDTNPHPGLYLTSVFAIHAAHYYVDLPKNETGKSGLSPIYRRLVWSYRDLLTLKKINLASFLNNQGKQNKQRKQWFVKKMECLFFYLTNKPFYF